MALQTRRRHEDEPPNPDALTEMVRRQLKALLGCVILTADGVDLKVTGFRFLGDPDAEHAIYPDVAARWSAAAEAPVPGRPADDSVSPKPAGGSDEA